MTERNRYDLNKNRSIFFRIGLAFSLLIILKVINYKTYQPSINYDVKGSLDSYPDIIELITMPVEKKKPVVKKELKKQRFHAIQQIKEIVRKADFIQKPRESNSIVMPKIKLNPKKVTPIILPKKKIVKKEKKIFEIVEVMPSFGDCDFDDRFENQACSDKAILAYFSKELEYPQLAKKSNIQGKVVAQFIIDENGEVINPVIVRNIGGGCGQEVIRVLRKMPNWKPGLQRDKHVKVKITVPISFKLN